MSLGGRRLDQPSVQARRELQLSPLPPDLHNSVQRVAIPLDIKCGLRYCIYKDRDKGQGRTATRDKVRDAAARLAPETHLETRLPLPRIRECDNARR